MGVSCRVKLVSGLKSMQLPEGPWRENKAMTAETPESSSFAWLLDFIVRTKNLRGVLYVSGGDPESQLEALKWIGRKFRYRDIGYHVTLVEKRDKAIGRRLKGQPYVSVDFPAAEMAAASRALQPPGLDEHLWRALTLASLYACPLILVDEPADALLKGVVFRITTDQPLEAASAKFHLRVCDYAAVDWFREVTGRVLDLAARSGEGKIAEVLESRRKLAIEDGEKRFWRLADRGTESIVILTIDPLFLCWDAHGSAVLGVCRKYGPMAAVLLSLVPGFIVLPGRTVEP